MKRARFFWMGLWLWLALGALVAQAGPPLPPEAQTLDEAEQWRLWQSQFPRPSYQPPGEWRVVETPHFRFHLLPGTAAARDVSFIARDAEASLLRVMAQLEMDYREQLDVYLVERVFWQGGAAYGGDEVLITYGDRNYVNIPLLYYLDHELTHALANRLIPDGGTNNSILAEGLAVWATGGHYGPEPIHAMAAALPGMGRYVPLRRLRDDFRAEQHEIAYIQSASFVGWLIETYGLDRVKQFYGAADQPERLFGASYETLEAAWLAWLEQEQGRDEVAAATAWWEAQIGFFDTMRAYETRFDPFARELPDAPSSWPVPKRLRYRENEDAPLALALETHLIAANERLACDADPAATQALLAEVEQAVAQGAVPAGGALAGRLAVAERLAAQDEALRRLDSEALLASAAPPVRARLALSMLEMARFGAARQETARLSVEGDRATARVAWYGLRGGTPRAWEMAWERQAAEWTLVAMEPIPTESLVPRSGPQCVS